MNVNLLPWRETAIRRRRWVLQAVLGVGVVILFLGLIGAIFIYHEQVQSLGLRQQQLSQSIEEARQRLHAQASTQMVSVHTPSGLRLLLHQLFFGAADGVCLTSLHTTSQGVVLHGQAPSEAALSHFLPTWPMAALVSSLRLASMNEDIARGVTVFELTGELAKSVSNDNDDLDA